MGSHVTPNLSANASPTADRRQVHNASVNEDAAEEGACAQVHLPTGRMCTLQYDHEGSCDFVAPDQVDASLARRRAAGGW
jgi:hypothetical protein